MIRNHFSLNAWHDYHPDAWGEFHVARFRVDWYRREWFSIDAGLLGLNVSVTFWPRGKFEPTLAWVLHYRGEPWIPTEGREHGEAGE